MKNIFNLRPIFIMAISLILGIVLTTNFCLNNNLTNLVLLILFCLLIIVLLIVFSFNYKKFKTGFFVVVFALIFALIGSGIAVNSIKFKTEILNTSVANFEGEVSEIKEYSSSTVLYVKNIRINNLNADGKIQLTIFNKLSSMKNLDVGSKVKGEVEIVPISKNSNNISYFIDKVYYRATCNLSNVEIISANNDNLKIKIKSEIKHNLTEVLNSTNSAISYSVLFGEKQNLTTETYNIFSYSGLAHILAVSGLHVGFLVALILMFLKLIKCNKHLSNIILFVVLFLYSYLCNFTPSVVRAFVMSMVLVLSKTYGKQYDGLNSLSLAAIMILLFNPLNIYSVGFQLSFVCVFSILTIKQPILNLLQKIKCPQKLAESLAISFAVNLGIVSITATHFNTISFVSIISNLFVLPIFSLTFSLLFAICFVGLIVPFLNKLLIIPNVMLHFIKLIANYFANLNILKFEIFNLSYVFVILSLLVLYFVGFALLKFKIKSIITCMLILFTICGTVLTNFPVTYLNNYATSSYTAYGNYVFLSTNNERVLVLNGVDNVKNVLDHLKTNRVSKINSLFVNNYSIKQEDDVIYLVKSYNIDNLYLNTTLQDVALKSFSKYVKVNFVLEQFTINQINFETIYEFNRNIALRFEFNGNKVLMLNDNITKGELYNIVWLDELFDYVFVNNVSYNLQEMGLKAKNYVLNKKANYTVNKIYLFEN